MAHDSRRRGGRWGKVYLDALTHLPAKSSAVAVYAYLCVHADVSGEAWPRPDAIAADLELSEQTVRRALGILIELGEVERTRIPNRVSVTRLRPR